MTTNNELLAALKSYEQADADGVMVKVSRQALDKAIALLEGQPEGTRPPEIQAAWHSGWDAAQEAWKVGSLPVTPEEDEAWNELEKRQ